MTPVDKPIFSKLDWLKRTHGHKLTLAEFRVLMAVYCHTDGSGKNAYPGLSLIAEEACVAIPTASSAIKSLKAAGWLREVSRGSGVSGRNSVYELVQDAPSPPSISAGDEPSTSASAEMSTSACAETNQVLISDPLTDPRELQVPEDLKHGESLVGGSPEGHHLPVEVEVIELAASSGKDDPWGVPSFKPVPMFGTPEWKAEQLASAIPWPSNKPLPNSGDPFAVYKDETTGELIH